MGMTYLKQLLIGLLLATTATLFAEKTPNATDVKKRIVILGDSITAGYGLDPKEAYPALLQSKITAATLPYTVANAGVSGDTTAGGLRRVAWAMTKGADILVIALGGNDGLRGISPAETKKNLLGIIKKSRSKNPKIKILIAGMQMPDNMGQKFTSRFKALFPEVAKETKTTLIPFLLEGIGGIEKLNQADGIHPTAKGQIKVSENVWKILLPTLQN
ncbi:MAG: acyl-CoA thioesterase-1 [Akkermansiaceae bacterium]|jgi:acyl-CoA thioesterase-1